MVPETEEKCFSGMSPQDTTYVVVLLQNARISRAAEVFRDFGLKSVSSRHITFVQTCRNRASTSKSFILYFDETDPMPWSGGRNFEAKVQNQTFRHSRMKAGYHNDMFYMNTFGSMYLQHLEPISKCSMKNLSL